MQVKELSNGSLYLSKQLLDKIGADKRGKVKVSYNENLQAIVVK